jgi:glyoxylase-like metal-dependent hydrolase (beta-lactamase superfamily II)
MRKVHLLIFLGVVVVSAAAAFVQRDWSQVQIKPTKIAGSVHMLEGSGGNIGLSVGEDGVLMIDDQFAPLADKIKTAINDLGGSAPKFVLNTHWHGDHTGGNEIFGKEATIVAHANVRKRLATESTRGGQTVPAKPKGALPVITFDESMSFHFNGEEIKVMHYPNGHTDGDAIILFTGSNVVHMGDDFFANRFPYVDLGSGGNVQGLIDNIGQVIEALPADVKIIPGHGPLSTISDLRTYHAMLLETTGLVRERMREGQSLDDIKKAGMPEKWASWPSDFITTERWINIIYESYSNDMTSK